MGVMPRKIGEKYIITSDRAAGEPRSQKAPKNPMREGFQVWTGDSWSTSMDAAAIFSALDAADDYIRENFDRVMG